MPILDVEQAKNVIVLKRGQGKGFAGIENDLFYRDNTRMLYGDAQESVGKLVQALKSSRTCGRNRVRAGAYTPQ